MKCLQCGKPSSQHADTCDACKTAIENFIDAPNPTAAPSGIQAPPAARDSHGIVQTQADAQNEAAAEQNVPVRQQKADQLRELQERQAQTMATLALQEVKVKLMSQFILDGAAKETEKF